jgi:hypothetical protein
MNNTASDNMNSSDIRLVWNDVEIYQENGELKEKPSNAGEIAVITAKEKIVIPPEKLLEIFMESVQFTKDGYAYVKPRSTNLTPKMYEEKPYVIPYYKKKGEIRKLF